MKIEHNLISRSSLRGTFVFGSGNATEIRVEQENHQSTPSEELRRDHHQRAGIG